MKRILVGVDGSVVAAQRLLDIAEVPLSIGGTIETTVRLTGPISRPHAQGALALRGQLGLTPEHASALRFQRGDRVPTALAVDGAPRITPDLGIKGRYPAVAARDGLQSMLSVPLVGPDETTVGALTVYGGPDRSFSIEDLEVFSTLASFGVAALAR